MLIKEDRLDFTKSISARIINIYMRMSLQHSLSVIMSLPSDRLSSEIVLVDF
jgi:hypothetical protein